MIKKLGVLVLLIALLVVGLKGYMSYSAMQFVERFKQEHSKNLSLSYTWLSADFDGKVHFEELVLTPFSLKRPVKIERLTLNLGDLGAMLMRLPDLQLGLLSAPMSLNYSGLSMPMKGRGLDEWLALFLGDEVLVPTGLYSCGERSRLDFSAMKAMGIDDIRASGKLSYDQRSGRDLLDMTTQIEKIGKVDLSLRIGLGDVNALIETGDISNVSLNELELKYLDSGYYRRLFNLCTEESGLDIDTYAIQSSKAWRTAMAAIGIIVNEGVQNLYRDKVALGGMLAIKASLPEPIKLADLEQLYDHDLIPALGLSAALNGEPRDFLIALLDGSYYRPAPPLDNKSEKKGTSQATVVLNRLSFQATGLQALPDFVGRKVKIKLKEGKRYQGFLKSANENVIEVTLIFDGGTADYFFANEKIEQVEVWR